MEVQVLPQVRLRDTGDPLLVGFALCKVQFGPFKFFYNDIKVKWADEKKEEMYLEYPTTYSKSSGKQYAVWEPDNKEAHLLIKDAVLGVVRESLGVGVGGTSEKRPD